MGTIDVINYFLGVLFIFLGFVVSSNPNLIAGYDSMSEDEKKNFNMSSFTQLLKRTLIVTGLFIIVGNFLFFLMSWNIGKVFISVSPGFVLPIFLIYKSKKSYSNQAKKNSTLSLVIFFTLIFILLMASFFLYAPKEPKVAIDNEELEISGFYGTTISTKEIYSIELTNEIPKILLRTNGLGLGSIMKGNFKLENEGICKLYLQGLDSPFIKVNYSGGKLIYLNLKDENKTTQLYNKLLLKINPDNVIK